MLVLRFLAGQVRSSIFLLIFGEVEAGISRDMWVTLVMTSGQHSQGKPTLLCMPGGDYDIRVHNVFRYL